MKKSILGAFTILAISLIWFTCSNCRSIRRNSDAKPVTHEIWDGLVKKHVNAQGFLDYQGFIQDSTVLNQYLHLLESAHPSAQGWSRPEQMAYWINAYNAYTVQLIVRNYPVKSIKDIKRGLAFVNSVWDIKFIHIQGYTYDLNNIEHNILRPVFKDARVHAAVNCASYSCPRLLNEAYTAEKLDSQLDNSMRSFINDPIRNQITPEKVQISEIFKWFKSDFERDAGSVRNYLNRYAEHKIGLQTDLSYLDYQWTLNESK